MTLTVAVALAAGCIRDDRSDCTCSVDLSFLYYGDGTSDIFPTKVDKVNLYVYSSANVLVEEHTYNKSALSERQGAHLDLMPGDYHIVLWGNAFDNTTVKTDWASASVSEPAWTKADSYVGTDSLYFSCIDLNVPTTLVDVNETCYFDCSHIDMHVKVTGFVGAFEEDGTLITSITLNHTNCPAWTDFNNVPSTADLCEVNPPASADPDDSSAYIFTYNVLRFKEADPTTLEIKDQNGNVAYTVDLAQFIADNAIALDDVQEAEVRVEISLNGVTVEVIEWIVEEVTPGFDK